jgi:hypothetical protein
MGFPLTSPPDPDQLLAERIFKAAFEGNDLDARRYALWAAGIILLSDALLRTNDEFTRERMLRSIEGEVRKAMIVIPEIQRGELH